MLSCSNPLLSYNCHEYTAEVRGANLSHETQKKLISVPVCVHIMAEELNILLSQNPEEQMEEIMSALSHPEQKSVSTSIKGELIFPKDR